MSSGVRSRVLLWIAVFCLVGLAVLPSPAGATTYQKIRVPYPAEGDRAKLFFHPDLEYMGDDDGGMLLLSRPELTDQLIARGFHVDVLQQDIEADYARSMREQGFRDYGVWHTYTETVAEMNLLHSQYPNLTTAPASMATTGEGRTIWMMKISDNPNVQENEPEVLFDGMIHAREIMTVEGILHYMRYLCENYGVDPVITYLVDNRQMWFVPILNVDGFVYNEQTNPNGGGMWRKNRRLNPGGCYGVDNNRNFPFEWVGGGSSTNPCDETFRGPSAGSEPENQGIMNLINSHHFVTWQSYHSVAGLVLFSWGYTLNHTPDDALFHAIGDEMASQSGYTVGQPPEVLYSVNGGNIDWGYGATTEHDKIFSFTTEFGGSGFWPAPSERDGLIAENLHSNIYLCQIAGAYLDLVSTQVTGGDGNGRLDPGESASIVITVKNIGVIAGATNVRAVLRSRDPYVQMNDASTTIGTLGPGATFTTTLDPFDVSIDGACPQGRSTNFTIHLTADGLSVDKEIALTIGQAPILYSNTFEPTGSDWALDPSQNCVTGTFVRIDPLGTNYQPGDDTTPAPGVNGWITAQNQAGQDGTDDVDSGMAASRSPVINLSGVGHAQLDLNYFCGQRDPGDDPNGDFFRIDLSNDGGTSFPANVVLVGDVSSAPDWKNVKVNIESLLPLTSNMMIRVQASDAAPANDIVEGGVDDVYIYDRGAGNEPPSAPTLIAPPDGAMNQPATPILIVANATDPEGDTLTYGFRVYSDSDLTQCVAATDGVPQGSGSTQWTTPALANGTYWWRAYASDPNARGLYMVTATFTVTGGTVSVPEAWAIRALSASPNPAGGDVLIRYYTPSSPLSTIEIVDAAGRQIRALDGARWSEGWNEIRWDGCDKSGRRVAAGTYWVRLVLPDETRTLRLVRIS